MARRYSELAEEEEPPLKTPTRRLSICAPESSASISVGVRTPKLKRLSTQGSSDWSVRQLRVTHCVEDLPHCERFLVYLNGLTWTRGEASASLAREIHAALDAGVPLMLVHRDHDLLSISATFTQDGGHFFTGAAAQARPKRRRAVQGRFREGSGKRRRAAPRRRHRR